MIASCTACEARYQLEDDKVPHRTIKVRCPSCSSVFTLDGTAREEAAPEPAAAEVAPEFTSAADEAMCTPPAPEPVASEQPACETTAPAAAVAVEDEPQAKSGARRRKCKEEMLARALVSDILVYNRELRDNALKEGTLLESLGGEIKKSWELYKEKVTADVANSTDYFRDALNDILAEGEKVF